MKCANCSRDAIYTVAPSYSNAINYCGLCIPTYLRDAAQNGAYPLDTPVEETSAPPATKKAKASKSTPASDTPEE